MNVFDWIGRWLARYLSAPRHGAVSVATCRPELLAASLRKGDVLLVEGSSRFSAAVKYLTQSTWSHAALYVGDVLGVPGQEVHVPTLLEADVTEGVRVVPLSEYAQQHTRICRPVGLSPQEIDAVVDYACSRLGHRYDLKNIIDLLRYLIQTPPVPVRWRRRMLALGSGDPTRAICSSLVAQAFQSIRYPILPEIEREKTNDPNCRDCYNEILHIRHHSLFTPKDFDVSPYFRIVKPLIEQAFDHRCLPWGADSATAADQVHELPG
jgi:hypothetical protein